MKNKNDDWNNKRKQSLGDIDDRGKIIIFAG